MQQNQVIVEKAGQFGRMRCDQCSMKNMLIMDIYGLALAKNENILINLEVEAQFAIDAAKVLLYKIVENDPENYQG